MNPPTQKTTADKGYIARREDYSHEKAQNTQKCTAVGKGLPLMH